MICYMNILITIVIVSFLISQTNSLWLRTNSVSLTKGRHQHPSIISTQGFLSQSKRTSLNAENEMSDVTIEAPTLNSRRITASILIDCPMPVVWSILTDYNNLATHVPNLVQSYLVPVPGSPNAIRLFQEGAQRIIGFDFRASLLMDMSEEKEDDTKQLKEWQVNFRCIESRMFDVFDGRWSLRVNSRSRTYDPVTRETTFQHKTKLTYSVYVKPKGPVPVMALEWRIREDIPINLRAVRKASEQRYRMMPANSSLSNDGNNLPPQFSNKRSSAAVDWGLDETLASYISQSSVQQESKENTSKNKNNAKGSSVIW